jgi:uncharacterized protein (DUF4415 family)
MASSSSPSSTDRPVPDDHIWSGGVDLIELNGNTVEGSLLLEHHFRKIPPIPIPSPPRRIASTGLLQRIANEPIRPTLLAVGVVRRGFDPDMFAVLRATGEGWQTRVNEMVRAFLKLAGQVRG